MFFDLGWAELLTIGVVALVVIGPKELPSALRTLGFWVRKARGLSREFQGSIEQMMREAELDEIRKDLKKATEFDLETEFHKAVGSTGETAESIRPPEIPDYFDGATEKPATGGSEGLPVLIPPPEMIGFEEPGPVDGAPASLQPPVGPGAAPPAVEPMPSKA